ncbi:pilus assembly protein TadG-related protein [Nitratireductor sp. ZSWI3]|uniref:pilus assembly protein TadG-related protein n=1 Tax=Nitratireductor sp. ZSWI3 TaxID=2966359 RepID=UPI00214F9D78|nr:pilus assembly protein TadG-related protein [Nitratireductor sp. ZSWI3]MCR4264852.1 pilus assembly protein TadG-related protein [Nitratireductor sp. ZSWI3]
MKDMLHLASRFKDDQDGVALILVSIMLPVIIGFALLVVDISRANGLKNDLQKGADAFAIAAAAELDGRSDSITRANRAIANLVDNTYRFSNAGTQQTLTSAGITRRYLRSLPANDSDPIPASMVIADEVNFAHEAQFVEVTVSPVGFSAVFSASFFGGSNSFNVGAVAVAGNSGAIICEMTPLFICNPFPGQDFHTVATDDNFYRRSIKLVVGGTSWGPGNFGFLRPKDDHGYGEDKLAEDLARGTLPECVSRRQVYTQTGNLTEKAKAAFNTRFDIYAKGAGAFPSKSNASWPPAPNIRKGFMYTPKGGNPGSNACDMQLATDPSRFRPLTPDTAFSGQIGNGSWDYEGYLSANGFSAADMAGFTDEDGNAYSNSNPPSRYELYKYEIAHNLVGDASLGGEIGTPACHATVGDAKRRMIHAAVLDCSDPAVQTQLQGQSGSPPAIGFASFFLTEAVTGNVVMAEIVDIDGVNGRGTMTNFVREDVQLYR